MQGNSFSTLPVSRWFWGASGWVETQQPCRALGFGCSLHSPKPQHLSDPCIKEARWKDRHSRLEREGPHRSDRLRPHEDPTRREQFLTPSPVQSISHKLIMNFPSIPLGRGCHPHSIEEKICSVKCARVL